MTLLGVPTEAKFSIGTSSTTAAASSGGGVDMSLDDMIKNRRKSARTGTNRRAAARKPTAADKAAGRQRATRMAKINARRGIQQSVKGGNSKPSAMEIEREVYRQARINNTPNKKKGGGPRNRKDAAAAVKARRQKQNETKKKAAQNEKKAPTVSTWVAGTKRPPSKKAVNAAVDAMQDNGFKVPEGMQMVITFAPAPETTPKNQKKQAGKQQNQKGGANQKKGGNKGRGGGRKK